MVALAHVVCGGPGAGKTYFSIALAARESGVRFTYDEWMQELYWHDSEPPIEWPIEYRQACQRLICRVCLRVLAAGRPLVLDLGFMQQEQRRAVAEFLLGEGVSVQLHIIEGSRAERWHRTQQRNQVRDETFTFTVTAEMFDFVDKMWSPPTDDEISSTPYSLVRRYPSTDEDTRLWS
jgi:predicted kinase